ncbi:hypothetical protein GF354_03250, partial [Candidatus Peregrinibacteria bacterium]|nr:hypothetical protein [Candidatus Peregrinibacteria bacterium]
MLPKYKKFLKNLKKDEKNILKKGFFGLELEKNRIYEDGMMARSSHPKDLGKPLTNSFFTLDFSEAQTEFITPLSSSCTGSQNFMLDLQVYAQQFIGRELYWPLSMPCALPQSAKIPIADFGKTERAKKSKIYRLGLAKRYGKNMQTICGTHFNFNFDEKLWDILYKKFGQKRDKEEFINNSYFKIQRNYMRLAWFITYLFGASPAAHKSYFKFRPIKLKKQGDYYYGKYATSLRMSSYGYFSKVQSQLSISQNSLGEYIEDMRYALNKERKDYRKIKNQLNSNILQNESEYYSPIRPKQHMVNRESLLNALQDKGIKYLEIRSLDLHPHSLSGILPDQICFMHLFLIYCLFYGEKTIDEVERSEINKNLASVALYGRKPGLKLLKNGKNISLKKWGTSIMKDIISLANEIGFCNKSLSKKFEQHALAFKDPELTLSAKILEEIKSEGSYLEYGIKLADQGKYKLKKHKISAQNLKKINEEIENSQLKMEKEKRLSGYYLEGYENLEVSTQIVIREALKRKIQVKVLDESESFIELKKGKKNEYVKQASKTSLDSYITFLIMENKKVSKYVLRQAK